MLLLSSFLSAQRLGLLPPGIKWHQLRDDSLRIIYPEGHEEIAQRVATLMLKLAVVDPITTEGRYRPVNVILQPHTNISNGYVGLAPYVSELYLQTNENPFSLGSLPWADLLAVHEYRHVQQVNAANTGLSHFGKLIFGDLAFTGLYNLAIPDWFREGDAVYAETKWTSQGRGRLSSFILPFHQRLMEREPWDYYMVRNGSYREYTPDHYSLGYLMVQYGNHLFGEETWDTIVREAASFKHLFGPFSGSVKERTGMRNKHLYSAAMNWYRETWNAAKAEDVAYPLVNIRESDMENDYFDMTFPDVNGDGSIMTAISTFDKTTSIYQIFPDGTRKRIVGLGLQQDTYFDHSNHRFVWTELRFDPRWLRQDHNVIVAFDELTANKITITPQKGYYTPSLDQRGTRIATLHEDREGNYNIHIIDARSGALLASLPNENNVYLGYPTWSEDEKHIIACARDARGRMALVEQSIETGAIRNISHYSFFILGKPSLHGNWIFVTSNIDQLDQVFAVDRTEGIFYKVSSGNNAHYDPSWDPVQDQIICSQYRLNGKKLVRLPGMQHQWKAVNLGNGIKHVAGETGVDLLAETKEIRSFEIKKYSPWSNPINIHSWTVTADDPVWGAEVRSDNIMNTISIAGGFEYNRNSRASGPYVDIRLGMWYPVLSLGVSRSSREVTAGDGSVLNVSNERLNTGISLPLFYSSGLYQQNVFLSSTYSTGISKVRPRIAELEDFGFNHLTHRIVISNARRRAYRQAVPSWGQRADISYAHELSGVRISQLYMSSDLALPAIRPSHYLMLHGEFMSQDISEGSIQLSSAYAGARGFNESDGKIQYRGGITYGFPLAYPDIGIGNIFYTRRLRLQPFYDIAYLRTDESEYRWMRSAGLEFIVDFDFPPVSVGIRYSRLIQGYEGSPDQFEFFLPVEKF